MTTAAPPNARWRNAVFAVFAFNGIGVATWVGRVPSFRDDLQLSAPELGLLLMGVSGGSVLGLLLSSHVLAWLGARRTIVWTMTACAVGLVIIGVGAETLTSFAVTFAGLALYGVGTAMCDIAINLEGAEVERERGKTIMPLFHAVWSMGSVLGAGAAAIAALATVPLPVHTTVMAVVILAGVLVSVRFLPAIDPEQEDARPSQSLTDRLRAWLEPRTLLIGVIALGMALAEGSAGDWLAVGLVDDRRVTNAAGTAFFAVFTAAMMVGRGVGSPLIDRFGRIPLLRVSALCGVAGLALVIFVDSPLAYAPGIVLWGLGAALGFPVAMSAAADDAARAAGRVSVVATIGYCAFLVGPPLIGFLAHSVGVLNALVVVLALVALAGLASPVARERRAGRAE